MPTKSIGDGFSNANAYQQSFGALANKTVYQDPYGLKSGAKTDMRDTVKSAFSVGLKAHGVTSGGAGTAGY
ncbi:hypothetical protein KAR91_60060, partial [Candidatus Pacearchaeota archaeon]|nr:hypothetical protein [Candidatus Pacearchaeota archaeon]